jgi:hypothetical protein
MKLDDAQKKTVIGWIDQGLKLAEIQKKLGTEMGLNPTYMEVRFLVDDLKVMPKDPELPKKAEPAAPATPAAAAPAGEEGLPPEDAVEPAPAGTGSVSVTLDQITRPGAMISGKVTFSDGNTAEWYLDQMGRLGVVPAVKGYKPTQEDVQAFQMELQRQLQKMGF